MDALGDSIDDTSEERSNDISEEPSNRQPPNRQLLSTRVWESEMDFDANDGLEELQSELEEADPLQEESIEDSLDEGKSATSQQVWEPEMVTDVNDGLEILRSELEGADPLQEEFIKDSSDEANPATSQKEIISKPRRVSEHTGSFPGNSKILHTVSKENEIESQGDDNSNLVTCSSSRPTLNKGFSFIKQQSLFNLLSRMYALGDSIDDTSEERSNDISEEPSNRQPPNRQLLSTRVWESEMDFDANDGLEELRSELEGADPLQEEFIKDSIDEANPATSQKEIISKPRRVSEHTGSFPENSKML